jgi:myosin-3
MILASRQIATMNYKGLSQHIDFNSLPNPEERFELQHVIGEGTYGKCYYAKGT